MKKTLSVMALSLLFVGFAGAQSKIVSPFGTPGGSNNVFPFGQTYMWCYQQFHSAADLNKNASFGIFTGIAWRKAYTSSYVSTTFPLQMDMSSAAPLASRSINLAGNHGVDRTKVVFGTGGPTSYLNVNWPATPSIPALPAPFDYKVPFNAPFIYKKQDICWEVRINKPRVGNIGAFDFISNSAIGRVKWSGGGAPRISYSTVTWPTYTNCKASDQTAYSYMYFTGNFNSTLNQWEIYPYGYRMKKSSTALYVIGSGNTQWGPFKLPFMIPGSAACALLTDITILGPAAPTNTSGYATWTANKLNIPYSPAIAGLQFYSQLLYMDAKLAMGVGTTRGVKVTLPAPSGPAFPPASAQSYWPGNGLVTQFDVK